MKNLLIAILFLINTSLSHTLALGVIKTESSWRKQGITLLDKNIASLLCVHVFSKKIKVFTKEQKEKLKEDMFKFAKTDKPNQDQVEEFFMSIVNACSDEVIAYYSK